MKRTAARLSVVSNAAALWPARNRYSVASGSVAQENARAHKLCSGGVKPERLAADTAYGSAATLDWIVNEKGVAPHIPAIDKSKREDGTFSRDDFTFDKARDVYICPAGELLRTTRTVSADHAMRYIAPVPVCRACPLKSKCCPNMPARRIVRDVNEEARDVARALAKTEAFEQSCRDRNRVEMLFAHLKRILRLGRLRLRGAPRSPVRVHARSPRPEPAPARQARRQTAATDHNVCCASLACVSANASKPPLPREHGNPPTAQRLLRPASPSRSPTSATKSARSGSHVRFSLVPDIYAVNAVMPSCTRLTATRADSDHTGSYPASAR